MDQISQVFLLFTCFHIPLLQILSGNDSRNMLGNLERPCGIGRVKIYWMKRNSKTFATIWVVWGRVALLKWLTYTIGTGLQLNCWLRRICEESNYLCLIGTHLSIATMWGTAQMQFWLVKGCTLHSKFHQLSGHFWLIIGDIVYGDRAMGGTHNSMMNGNSIWCGKSRWGEVWTRKLTYSNRARTGFLAK